MSFSQYSTTALLLRSNKVQNASLLVTVSQYKKNKTIGSQKNKSSIKGK